MKTSSTTAWSIGVGDPTIDAWIITAGYFVGAVLCFKSYTALKLNKSRASDQRSPISFNTPLFWMFSGSVMFILGLNKQLDFQTLLIQLLQNSTAGDNLQEQHRLGKKSFFVIFSAATGYALLVTHAIFRNALNQVRVALIGLALLLIYIVFRAASIHHFQGATETGTAIQQLMYLTEPAGVLALIFAAGRFIQRFRFASEYRRDKT